MGKPIYGLVGRVNIPNIQIMERGRFVVPLDVPCDDNSTAITEAERIFGEKFSKLKVRQSIMGYVHKDGTAIHTFPEVKKE